MASTSRVESDALLAKALQDMETFHIEETSSSPKLQGDELDDILNAGLQDLEEEERKAAGLQTPLLQASQEAFPQDLDEKVTELTRLKIPENIIAKAKEDPEFDSMIAQTTLKMAEALPMIAFRLFMIDLQVPESIKTQEARKKWMREQLTPEELNKANTYMHNAIIEHYSTQKAATPNQIQVKDDELDAILNAGLQDLEGEMTNIETTVTPHVVDPTLKALQEALGNTGQQLDQLTQMQKEMEKLMSSMPPEQLQQMTQTEEAQKQRDILRQSALKSLPEEASPETIKKIVEHLTSINVPQHIIAVAQTDLSIERIMVRIQLKIGETLPEIESRIQKLSFEHSFKAMQAPETIDEWVRSKLTPEEHAKINKYECEAITQHYSTIIANTIAQMEILEIPENIIRIAKHDPYLLGVVADISKRCDTQYPKIAKKAAQIRFKAHPEAVEDVSTYNRWMESQLDTEDVAIMNKFEKDALIAHYSEKKG